MTDSTNATLNGRHTPEVHYGKPSPSSNFHDDWVTTKVHFHEFAMMDSPIMGYCVESPTFFCLGREWVLKVHPHGQVLGDLGDAEREGIVAVLLQLRPPSSAIKFNMRLSD
jgi:hypothetical protein